MEHKIYQQNKDSEKIRNENEMRRLRRKLTNERLKSETVKQFEDLMKDDGNMTEYVYPVKAFANDSMISHAERRTNADYAALQVNNDSGRRVEEGSQKNGTADDDYDENGVHVNARPEKINGDVAKNDFQPKREYAETGNDEKITLEGKKHDAVGKDG